MNNEKIEHRILLGLLCVLVFSLALMVFVFVALMLRGAV
jgi:hypothetical protein